MLHTHSFTYHPHYIKFLSKYFSFPLSVPFHQCTIPIHSPTTHTIQYFSPSTSVFPCQYHSTNAPYPFIHLPPTLYNVSLPVIQFPLSLSLHQRSAPIFILTLLTSEGQVGEAWEPSNKEGVLNLFCAMEPFESLAKPTAPFSEKCISMHKTK